MSRRDLSAIEIRRIGLDLVDVSDKYRWTTGEFRSDDGGSYCAMGMLAKANGEWGGRRRKVPKLARRFGDMMVRDPRDGLPITLRTFIEDQNDKDEWHPVRLGKYLAEHADEMALAADPVLRVSGPEEPLPEARA